MLQAIEADGMVLSLKKKTEQVALCPHSCQQQRSTLSIGNMHIVDLQEKVKGKSYKLKCRRQYIDLERGYCRQMALPA